MKKIFAIMLVAAFALGACGANQPTPNSGQPNQGEPRPTKKVLPESAVYDQAHLAKLSEGVEAWNLWRTQNPDIKPDLMRADLRDQKFIGIDFSSTSFVKARLDNAVLRRANLRGANLKGASLTGADLLNARLINANLMGADLTGANLSGVKLTGARYDAATVWPAGFDPIAAGATLEQ